MVACAAEGSARAGRLAVVRKKAVGDAAACSARGRILSSIEQEEQFGLLLLVVQGHRDYQRWTGKTVGGVLLFVMQVKAGCW